MWFEFGNSLVEEVLKAWLPWLVGGSSLLTTILFSLIQIFVLNPFWEGQKKKKEIEQWGGWILKTLAYRNGEGYYSEKAQEIGLKKIQSLLGDVDELAQFLKRNASPYGWLIIDILDEGEKLGVFSIDKEKREILLDFTVTEGVFAPPRK